MSAASLRGLLDPALASRGPGVVAETIVDTARAVFGVPSAALLEVRPDLGAVAVTAGAGASLPLLVAVSDLPSGLTLSPAEPERVEGDEARAFGAALRWPDSRGLVLVALPGGDAPEHIVVLGDRRARIGTSVSDDAALAFAAAAAVPLAQLRRAAATAGRSGRAAALMRGAEALHDGDDLDDILRRLCVEAAAGLGVERAVVWRGGTLEGLTAAASSGFTPDVRGWRLGPGEGVAGQVSERGAPMVVADDVERVGTSRPFGDVRAVAAVPLAWSGETRGVLAVYDPHPDRLTPDAVPALDAFGKLVGVAMRHADEHRGLARAASTDALTGCLNHAALHAILRREVERSQRTGHELTLALIDLDDFKTINERHGHLVGDEVLRRVGQALRDTVRPYDHVARYGGDEFALLAVDAGETEAADIAGRALERLRASLGGGGLPATVAAPAGATAGVAEWAAGMSAVDLVAEADRALLFGKQQGRRGEVSPATSIPEGFVLGGGGGRAGRAEPAARRGSPPRRGSARELALVGALAARLADMTDPAEIAGATVDELQRAGGYELCAAVHVSAGGWGEAVAGHGAAFARRDTLMIPPHTGVVGRALRGRRPVIVDDVVGEADHVALDARGGMRAELAVPVWQAGESWGALAIADPRPGVFDGDDVRLVSAAAEQLASALRSADQYGRLETAYIGTAEALASALEARDTGSEQRARDVARHAEKVGRLLALPEVELRDLRLGAILHDVGKIAVPERILRKPGPLTADERRTVEHHAEAGEDILRQVPFLAGALPLVRHGHERWDGLGYPDGLAGEEIPLGARIIAACDAWNAMRSDRAYHPAMSGDEARGELLSNAGTQFDPGVVNVLLQAVAGGYDDGDVAAARSTQPRAVAASGPPCRGRFAVALSRASTRPATGSRPARRSR